MFQVVSLGDGFVPGSGWGGGGGLCIPLFAPRRRWPGMPIHFSIYIDVFIYVYTLMGFYLSIYIILLLMYIFIFQVVSVGHGYVPGSRCTCSCRTNTPVVGRGVGLRFPISIARRGWSAASGLRGNTSKRFEDFRLKAKARIWPWLSYVGHIRSAAVCWCTPVRICVCTRRKQYTNTVAAAGRVW